MVKKVSKSPVKAALICKMQRNKSEKKQKHKRLGQDLFRIPDFPHVFDPEAFLGDRNRPAVAVI